MPPILSNPPLDGPLRLEADVRDDDLRRGLQARIADPLWLLGRQWQVGEFRGEDAGSPIRAALRLQIAPTIVENAAGVPAEVAVEREPVAAGPGRLGLAVDLGLRLKAALLAVDGAAAWDLLRRKYPLAGPLPADLDLGLRLRAARSLAALALLADMNTARELVPAAPPGLRQALARWAEATRDEWTESAALKTWQRDRLVYTARAQTADGGVLRAPHYTGDRLDWYSFNLARLPGDPPTSEQVAIPAPVSFRGMPAARWWELEDGEVHLMDVEGSTTDLIETFIAEFATLYGDDWFLVPLRLPFGALARVARLEVTDVFGVTEPLPALARKDSKARRDGKQRSWRMFELAGEVDPGGDPQATPGPWLYFPDALLDTQYGAPIEEVRLLRDEQSNLGWGVERVIESPDGKPCQRSEHPPAADPTGMWSWRAMTAVPRGWIPLLPARVSEDSAEIVLQRARLPDWGPEDGARGAILGGAAKLLFPEAEIQTTATTVQRLWQRSRNSDGRVLVWLGRRQWSSPAGPGAGLAFDRLKR